VIGLHDLAVNQFDDHVVAAVLISGPDFCSFYAAECFAGDWVDVVVAFEATVEQVVVGDRVDDCLELLLGVGGCCHALNYRR